MASRKAGEFRYATRHLMGKRNAKELTPLKACKHLLESDDWESSKFSLTPKTSTKKSDAKTSALKDVKGKHPFPKSRDKVVIVSKRSSSVRVVKSGTQKCMNGVQRSVSVKKVSYSTSVILSSDDESDSEEEEEEEEEDDEDDDEEDDDYDDKSRACKKGDTVIKHTMSKIRTNYCNSKKVDCRSSKKARALKLLREKSASKKKANVSSRELRPRFPYSPTQEWPTARAHRMASLNALAKVHVLYENEGRAPGEVEENSIHEILYDDNSIPDSKSDCKKEIASAKESKSASSAKEKEKETVKNNANSSKRRKSPEPKPKAVKRRRTNKELCDVEIIDTRMCKRMASLNAQAILAASYVREKPKRREKIKKEEEEKTTPPDSDVDIKEIALDIPDLQIIDSEKKDSPLHGSSSSQEPLQIDSKANCMSPRSCKVVSKVESKNSSPSNCTFPDKDQEKDCVADLPAVNEICLSPSNSCSANSSALATTSVSEVGVTKYTKVTKVQINTTKEMGIKEESEAEQKIERIVAKDDVAITRMYHYQSNSASQSYSLRMETTYKPASRNVSSSVSGSQRSGPIASPHVMGAVMPTRQSYYNYQKKPGALASQSYPVNRSVQPMIGMDQHVPRHYDSSAFRMPHYGQTPPMPYPHNEYGYYQPAGPMIQPVQDQYMIHKPVPYHPHSHAQLHQAQPPAPSTSSNCDRYPMNNPQNFCRQSDATLKSKRNASASKCAGSSRITMSQSPPRTPRQYANRGPEHSRAFNGRSSSHSCSAELELTPSVVPKHYNGEEKPENIKYHGSRNHGYTGTQESPYSSPNCHNFPPGYAPSQHQALSMQQDKSQPMFSCHVHANEKHPQYLSPHHPLPSMSVSPKIELPGVHDSAYAECNKYVSEYSHADNSTISRNSEAQNDDRYEQNQCLWHPPLVVDVDSDSEPKNTKTYIELDVPKACPREKIVVVDVDKEEKEQIIRKHDAANVGQCHSIPNKDSSAQPEVIELDSIKVVDVPLQKGRVTEVKTEPNSDRPKEMPDIMFIEMTKKKEPSALIRRAKLHGKQRTYRDSENRPLAPYSNAKKGHSAEIPPHYQKSIFQPQVSLPRLVLPKRPETKILHGWSWEGKPSEKLVYISNDDPPFLRLCYPSIRHQEGDVIRVRDCVLLKSGARKTDLPFIAKITALWENPVDGEMTMSLLWYYRPEHTEPGRKPCHTEGEIFASKHCDTNSVACIEDRCYVLTFGEYCRYRRHCKMLESTFESPFSVVPPLDDYPRKERLPPSYISPEMVFVCRKVYDFRQKRILKNPV